MNAIDLRTGLLIPAVLTASLAAPMAFAEDDDELSNIEEVVVTAQRREQKLTDVPLSVSAFSGELLEEKDIHDLEGVASRTPSLNFSPFSPGQNIITLRGASSNDDGAGTDNSVALFLDDVYIGRSSNINFEMADLERVEVLRGPQGTLYGKNALGGAINVITRKPSVTEAYGSISGTYGNYDLRLFKGYYSSPVGNRERWAVKVAGSTRVRDGWVTNVLRPNDNLKNQNAQVIRFQAMYEGSKTSVLIGADRNFLDIDDMGRIPIARGAVGDDGPDTRGVDGYKADTGLTTFNRKIASNPVDGFARRNAGGMSIKVDHNFSDTDSMMYIFAYRNSTLDWEMDSVGATTVIINDNIFDKTKQNQHEFRFNHDRESWKTTYGLWFSTEETDRTEAFDLRLGGVSGTDYTDSYTQENTTGSIAFYGQTEWLAGKSFYLVFGGRYTQDSKEITSSASDGTVLPCDTTADPGCSPNDIPFIINTDLPRSTRSESWAAFTPKLTFGFRMGERKNHNIYLDYSTGFKSGGFPAAPTRAEDLNPIKPETSSSIEFGYKGSFVSLYGFQTRFNAAYFITAYADLQIQQFGAAILANGQASAFGIFRTINAPDAAISGLEMDVEIRPSEYFYLSIGGAWVNSEYGTGVILPTGANIAGKSLLRTPDQKYFIAMGGDVPSSSGHIFRWSLDYRHEGETLHDLTNDLGVSPAHALMDMRLAWISPQGFEFAMWGKNILDEVWRQHIYTVGPGTIAVFGDPYTWGGTFKYNF